MRKTEDGPVMRLGTALNAGSQRRIARLRLDESSTYRLSIGEKEEAEGNPFETTPEQWLCNDQAIMLRQLADLIETMEVPLEDTQFEFRPQPVTAIVLANADKDPQVVAQQEKLQEDAAFSYLHAWRSVLLAHGVEHRWFDSSSPDWAYCGWLVPLGSLGAIRIDAGGRPHVMEAVQQRLK